ncbi:MAG: HIT family hydrolase [Firmicutes bacterium]|nr:HIT family hydrolase [Bacillota bacterium]
MRKTFLGEPIYSECVGCGIVKGEFSVPGGLICETENFALHLDPEVPIEYFFIIGAKRHVRYIHELTENEAAELAAVLRKARLVLLELNSSVEFTVIAEERSRHLHVWLFPRLPWMDGYEDSLTSIRKIMLAAKKMYLSKEQRNKILGIAAKAAELFGKV